MFRLICSIGVLFWYSVNVWNMIADYFNKEFHKIIYNKSDEIEYEYVEL